MENWIEMMLFGFAISYLVTLYTYHSISSHFGALAVLLAWMELTLLMGRFPAIGIYVYMSVHVTKMLITFFLFYATILIGFAFAFHLLLPQHPSFDNPLTSSLKVLVMMSGEFDFEDNFLWQSVEGKGSNGTAQAVFLFFFFIVSIVISNLLIGMTVSKTEELFKKAGLIKLEKMAEQIMGLEDIVNQKTSFVAFLPEFIRRVLIEKTQIFPQLNARNMGNFFYKPIPIVT
jgi:hypothetical protein